MHNNKCEYLLRFHFDYYNSIAVTLKEKDMDKKKKKIWGDPEYPAKDDIYANEKIERFEDEASDDNDLDVPGSEEDDQDEKIGEEDEENNYYSLGGDDHNDLDEREDNETP
jgi:hypothetical protein